MKINKILLAGLVGAIVALLLGFLAYDLLLGSFFAANLGSATGVMREETEMLWVPMILGHLSWGMLFAVIYGHWANISTFATGAKAGAILGFLVGFTFDMINLGTTHIMSPTGAIADVVVMIIISAIVGGVVGWFLGRDTPK
jgi:uncharacterized membrane protein